MHVRLENTDVVRSDVFGLVWLRARAKKEVRDLDSSMDHVELVHRVTRREVSSDQPEVGLPSNLDLSIALLISITQAFIDHLCAFIMRLNA